jgi:hypothetical protein
MPSWAHDDAFVSERSAYNGIACAGNSWKKGAIAG